MLTHHAQLPIECSFLSIVRKYHHPQNPNKDVSRQFHHQEKIFLNFFQIGLFETYNFLYSECTDDEHFKNWIIGLKGESCFREACVRFNQWYDGEAENIADTPFVSVLTEEQHQFWEENGYLKIDRLIDEERCNAVVELITRALGIDMAKPESWYQENQLLQGLMLQLYQHQALDDIRNDKELKSVFASLYGLDTLLPNCEKVSFNPPQRNNFSFKGSPLHWDIDFSIGPKYYIQSLVYLNDVPANRGAFSLIPGYHKLIDRALEDKSPEVLIQQLKAQNLAIPIAGKQGDLILWLQSIPHAATPNNSDVPRFVQYLSFNKLHAK
ncbi:phytanoyl-CoA dioxygenase family protein [Pedobacter sp. GSP4]|uniref:phytanoyl-CoA dioxygenase family protein n=1 Tax=Pedobacter sp. GSP4 TaxID=3453716 RepID=UPI003EEF68F5